MSRTPWVVKLTGICLILSCCNGQQKMRGGAGGARGGRRRDRPLRNVARSDGDSSLFKAFTINYPLNIFNVDKKGGKDEWREPGKFSAELSRYSDMDKPYTDLAQAQDQEDIWLYENWFYGMEKGVIMESGALNGLLFSTSYMFERFANWSALHVGNNKHLHYNIFVFKM